MLLIHLYEQFKNIITTYNISYNFLSAKKKLFWKKVCNLSQKTLYCQPEVDRVCVDMQNEKDTVNYNLF